MKTIVDYATKVKEQHALNKTLAPVETDLTDASRAYAIGEQFIYNGELFKAKTAIAQHDALVLNTNYEAADNLATEIEALTNNLADEVSARAKLGAHNLGKKFKDGVTSIGITLKDAPDGGNYINGTSTSSGGRLNLISDNFVLKAGTYSIVGESNDHSKYSSVVLQKTSDNSVLGSYLISNGIVDKSQATVTLAADTECYFGFNTSTGAAYGIDTFIIYPMVKFASDPDNTYQPYAKTNQELTAENQTLTNKLDDEVSARAELGAHQFSPFDVSRIKALNTSGTWNNDVYTINGGTITLNTDKETVTVDGTFSENASFFLYRRNVTGDNIVRLPDGAYKVRGGTSSIEVIPSCTRNNAYYEYATSHGDDVPFEVLSTDGNSGLTIYIKAGTYSNVEVKPLIRSASDPSTEFAPYAMTNRELTPKHISYSGTTSAAGNLVLSPTLPEKAILLCVYASDATAISNYGYICTPYVNTSTGIWVCHLTKTDGTLVAETATTVECWYIEP